MRLTRSDSVGRRRQADRGSNAIHNVQCECCYLFDDSFDWSWGISLRSVWKRFHKRHNFSLLYKTQGYLCSSILHISHLITCTYVHVINGIQEEIAVSGGVSRAIFELLGGYIAGNPCSSSIAPNRFLKAAVTLSANVPGIRGARSAELLKLMRSILARLGVFVHCVSYLDTLCLSTTNTGLQKSLLLCGVADEGGNGFFGEHAAQYVAPVLWLF